MKKKFAKRLLSWLMSAALVVSMLPLSAMAAETTDWNVNEDTRTVSIYTATGLREWADSVRESNNRYDGYTISIEDNIDLSGENWTSIISLGGTVTIDGNNHTISNMTISEQANGGSSGNTYLGFIGNLNYNTKLTVQDITFENAHVQDLTGDGESSWCGVVVGHGPMDGVSESQAECTFTNVNIVNSVVTGGHNNGAILGYSCSTERGHLFENCSVTDTFVGGYNSTSGILFGMGIANVTVKNCSADGVRLYTDGLNFDCSQSWDKQLWAGNVYPLKIYGNKPGYGSGYNGSLTIGDNNTLTDSYVVYPVLYHYTDSTVQEYVQVNSEDALAPVTANWYSDEDYTKPVTQIVAGLTNKGIDDMYPYGKSYGDPSITNNQTYDTQDTDNVANPLTHGAIELYTNEKNPGKTSYPGLDKVIVTDDGEVESDTAAAGADVNFKLTSNVPDDLLNYLNPDDVYPPVIGDDEPGNPEPGIPADSNRGHYALTFHDQMDEEFEFDPESVVVMVGDTELVPVDEYTISYNVPHEGEDPETVCDFEITIDLVGLYESGAITSEDIENATSITVTYTATLADDAKAGSYENEAWVHYPDTNSSHDTVEVITYGINIFKYDQAKGVDGKDAGLADAKFALYDEKAVVDGALVEGATPILTGITSGANGYARIDGLDEGIYYLVETEAPTGYVKSDTPLKITIADDAGADYLVHVDFALRQLPHPPHRRHGHHPVLHCGRRAHRYRWRRLCDFPPP